MSPARVLLVVTAMLLTIATTAVVTVLALSPTDATLEVLEPVADVDVRLDPEPEAAAVGTEPAAPVESAPAPEPRFDCRPINGVEICDTFDEADEGPGTTTAFAPAPEPMFDCRPINDVVICDTFDEADEGPGTR